MLLEDKSVKHVLTINGTTETFESGYHLQSIAEKFNELREARKEQCESQFKKYFGEDTELGKLAAEIKELAAKKPEEQTEEDMKKVNDFFRARKAASIEYMKDENTPKIVSTRKIDDKDQILFDGDLESLATSTAANIMSRQQVAEEIGRCVYDIMRKSDLKLTSIALKFEDDPENKVKNHSVLVFGSAFRDIGATDVAVLDGTTLEIHDSIIPDIRKKLDIGSKEPEIIT
jgi:hypothetical protein